MIIWIVHPSLSYHANNFSACVGVGLGLTASFHVMTPVLIPLSRAWSVQLLKILNSNTENPYLIWDNATRAQLGEYLADNQKRMIRNVRDNIHPPPNPPNPPFQAPIPHPQCMWQGVCKRQTIPTPIPPPPSPSAVSETMTPTTIPHPPSPSTVKETDNPHPYPPPSFPTQPVPIISEQSMEESSSIFTLHLCACE